MDSLPEIQNSSTRPNSGPYVFESCIAENNTIILVQGTGFDIFNLVDSEIINCVANSNNIGINVTDFGIGASNDNIFRGNVVSANTAYGIRDNKPLNSTPKNNAYYSNQAKKNGRTPATTNYSGAGIFPTASCNTRILQCSWSKPHTSAFLEPSSGTLCYQLKLCCQYFAG